MRELVDEEVFEIVSSAIDDGLAALAESGLVPFAMIEEGSGRRVRRFVAEPYEEGVRQARLAVAREGAADRVLIAYDGFVTVAGERTDALLIEAQDRRRPHSVSFVFCYRPASSPYGFEPIGDAVFTGPGDPLLQDPRRSGLSST